MNARNEIRFTPPPLMASNGNHNTVKFETCAVKCVMQT